MDLPDQLLDLPVPWWIGGSRALAQFTAVRRPHPDTDLTLFADDLPSLAAALPGLTRVSPDRLAAGSLDVWLNSSADGNWVFPLDPSVVLPLDDVTWESGGVRYLRPEFVLLFKAEQKATADLESTLPWLRASARERLAELLERVHPGHAWLDLV
ncbi:hypothetical protein FKR81_27260 [Lentzea tibetensis]|uniref:Aminoglycoside-2''-adenylyltransferase n=1 Tax=Lentzea tibetensis TaxID=2591470 RepID=A0A563EMT0_9PSEU|nr:hypothetical protein [Lentzea tibetensis]TWP48628.1 hypothetical protein FKR81_27260 [Lentzea tibetensis]